MAKENRFGQMEQFILEIGINFLSFHKFLGKKERHMGMADWFTVKVMFMKVLGVVIRQMVMESINIKRE